MKKGDESIKEGYESMKKGYALITKGMNQQGRGMKQWKLVWINEEGVLTLETPRWINWSKHDF